MKTIRCLFLALAFCGVTAQASLTDNSGYVSDSTTGLDWLKLNTLVGYSYQSVLAGALGYTTSGWRYATASELLNLYEQNIGPVLGNYGEFSLSGQSPSYTTSAENLIVFFGMNIAFNDSRAAYNITNSYDIHQISIQGFFDDGNPNNNVIGLSEATTVLFSETAGIPAPLGRWMVAPDWYPSNISGYWVSSFLVRETASYVPEPGSIALLGLGLAAVTVARRRRHA